LGLNLYGPFKEGSMTVNTTFNLGEQLHKVLQNLPKASFRQEQPGEAAGILEPEQTQQGVPVVVPHECREAIKKQACNWACATRW
jgi:hypothetical protein